MNRSNHLIPTALTIITMAFCQIGFAQYEPQSDATLGQGTMAGEVTHHSALLQTRLTRGTELNDDGDLPGADGFVTFEWDTDPKFTNSEETPLQPALPERDYIVRAELRGLEPDRLYFYRASYNRNENERTDGPTCSFRTLPGPETNEIDNVFLFCGDRHWQYHSIHPCGINEFACGALNDENSRNGVRPGDRKGTDPDAMVVQPYISPEPSGGFIEITAGPKTQVSFFNDEGRLMYQFDLPEKAPGN